MRLQRAAALDDGGLQPGEAQITDLILALPKQAPCVALVSHPYPENAIYVCSVHVGLAHMRVT